MGKKTEKVLSALALAEAVSASVALESVAVGEDGKPENVLTVTAWKGKLPPETAVRYQCGKDGVFGAVAGTVAAALGALLDALKIHKEAYAVPTKVAFAVASDNEPKEAETFDELDEVEKAAMVAELADFRVEVAMFREAGARTRAATLAVARKLAEIRKRFATKKRFGIFVKYAASVAVDAREAAPDDAATAEAVAVAEFLTSKNTPSEFLFLASLPESLLSLMPEEKISPKAAAAWVAGLRSAAAAEIVGLIKRDEELAEMTLSEAVRVVLPEVIGTLGAAGDHLAGLHLANWPKEGGMFDADASGKVSPAKTAEKAPVVAALFGSEGSDELLKAIAVAFNGYRTEAEKEAEKEAKAKVAPLASRDFASLPVGEVALHLFRILAGRISEDTEETLSTSCADCTAIVEAVGDMVASVASGEKTLDDILNPTEATPEDEGEAEADADAAA